MNTNNSNELFDLFSGVAVVIDDEIDTETGITSIVKQLEAKKIPVLKYDKLPETAEYKHFHNVSFVLLDWNLYGQEFKSIRGNAAGARLSSEHFVDLNINFLRELKEVCFAPIFIFTNENPDDVKAVLKEKKLYNDDPPNYIFVKSKKSLKNNKVIETISKWIENNPPVYVLKKWEKHFRDAKSKTFFDLYDISPSWPEVLWKTFEKDSINPNIELRETISRIINSSIDFLEFKPKYIVQENYFDAESIRKVLDEAKFIKNEYLDDSSVRSGDLFYGKINEKSEDFYWLNIRADCDLIDRSSKQNENIMLYCIRGRTIDESNSKNKVSFTEGRIIEKNHQAIVYGIDGKDVIEFNFKHFQIVKHKQFIGMRKGRLLHPYLTHIQQRFAFFIHRQGLPRLPDKIIQHYDFSPKNRTVCNVSKSC